MDLFQTSEERAYGQRRDQFDALAQKMYETLTHDPATRREISPVVNAHATHTYTSVPYTIPDGYESAHGNTVQLQVAIDRWGDMPITDYNSVKIARITMIFGRAATQLTQAAQEQRTGNDEVIITLSRKTAAHADSAKDLALISIGTQAAIASTHDSGMPEAAALCDLTDARIAQNYKKFTLAEKAMQAIIDTKPVVNDEPEPTPESEGDWDIYGAPVEQKPISPQPDTDTQANVAILQATLRDAPADSRERRNAYDNGYTIAEFARDHNGVALPRKQRELIARLAQAQAAKQLPDSVVLSGSAQQRRDMYVINQPISMLPIGYEASLHELLLTEQAYQQTLKIHPEWFTLAGIGVEDDAPDLYWITGKNGELRIGTNTDRVPYDHHMNARLGLSNHIGLRNMVLEQVIPSLDKLSKRHS